MLVIGNKKYRNLQEQVGWNTEQIDKIFEFLDGINVSDNVVVVLDISTPLTAEQLEIVNREVAFIVYNGELYFKRNQDSSYIYFDIIFQVTSGTVITLTSSEIAVTKSNGALGITNSTDYVYSKTQVDSLLSTKADTSYVSAQLALKANLAGANFTGAITAPSIIENMSGYSVSIPAKANLVITPIYYGICKNGNKLTMVFFAKLQRTGTVEFNYAYLSNIYIPEDVGNKLYPYQVASEDRFLSRQKSLLTNVSDASTLEISANLLKNSNSLLTLPIYNLDTLDLNEEYLIRLEYTFLLSPNLAS